MGDSLRDQLLKAGLKPTQPAAAPKRSPAQVHGDNKAQATAPARKPAPRRARSSDAGTSEEMDLARAYALRHAQEQRERAAAARIAEEKARLRKQQREQVHKLLEGRTLNRADAELMRHFEYGGKIRRVHVDAAQLQALNDGALGVVQMDGRYLLVERAVAEAVRACAPQHLALLPEPGAGSAEEA